MISWDIHEIIFIVPIYLNISSTSVEEVLYIIWLDMVLATMIVPCLDLAWFAECYKIIGRGLFCHFTIAYIGIFYNIIMKTKIWKLPVVDYRNSLVLSFVKFCLNWHHSHLFNFCCASEWKGTEKIQGTLSMAGNTCVPALSHEVSKKLFHCHLKCTLGRGEGL